MELIPTWLWFIAGLGLLVLELTTVTFFFGTVGFGALVASLVDFLFPGEIGSFIAFAVGTGLAAYLAWKFDIYSSEGGIKTGADRLISERGTVEERIDPAKGDGIVVVNGERWRAESPNDESIDKGETVEVNSIEGTSLVVVPFEETEQESSSNPEEG
jgi:membrane protein implicated in regulation of membrane protease activity